MKSIELKAYKIYLKYNDVCEMAGVLRKKLFSFYAWLKTLVHQNKTTRKRPNQIVIIKEQHSIVTWVEWVTLGNLLITTWNHDFFYWFVFRLMQVTQQDL